MKDFFVLATNLQKKWKSLRDSFNRELKTLKKVETGKGASKRKKYLYFEQLLFLEPLAQQRQTTTNLEAGDVDENADIAENIRMEVSASSSNTKQKKKKSDKEDEIIKVLQQRIIGSEEANNVKNISQDEDTLFCLSLVGDLKKIVDDMKTDAKCEVLQVLSKYKRLSAPVYGHSSQTVQHNNLGVAGTSSARTLQHTYTNYNPSVSGIAQQQNQHVPPHQHAPQYQPVAQLLTERSQPQTYEHIPLSSPTYSTVSSPNSVSIYPVENYQNDTEDTNDSVITDLF